MSKRTATEVQTSSTSDGQPFSKASRSGSKRETIQEDEMGDFEDPWEDEIEEEEIDPEDGNAAGNDPNGKPPLTHSMY
jgi:ribosome assembly protein RRB1